jgi:hypothetical protein
MKTHWESRKLKLPHMLEKWQIHHQNARAGQDLQDWRWDLWPERYGSDY